MSSLGIGCQCLCIAILAAVLLLIIYTEEPDIHHEEIAHTTVSHPPDKRTVNRVSWLRRRDGVPLNITTEITPDAEKKYNTSTNLLDFHEISRRGDRFRNQIGLSRPRTARPKVPIQPKVFWPPGPGAFRCFSVYLANMFDIIVSFKHLTALS
jgi:hypothetical protein